MFGTKSPKVKPTNTMADGLALRGYDPVVYFTDGKAIEGHADLEYVWNGARYRFSSKSNRDLFAADPERYAPQYGGYCSWGISQEKVFDGDPTVWKVVDGKLYLNYNRDIEKTWEQDIPGFIERANQRWPKMAAR
jgi:YHS domain-containing protein